MVDEGLASGVGVSEIVGLGAVLILGVSVGTAGGEIDGDGVAPPDGVDSVN